jgi:glycosyltransferase involved in cell wall biosynthesis
MDSDCEIIIVNDGIRPLKQHWNSLDKNVIILENQPKSMDLLGYPSGGYARNIGIQAATGQYIAFLDDDDQYEDGKISQQLQMMEAVNAEASCTDAFISVLPFKFFTQRVLYSIYYRRAISKYLKPFGYQKIPPILTNAHLNVHNLIITSSVILSRKVIDEIGCFSHIKNHGQLCNGKIDYQDWEMWRRVSSLTNFYYLEKPLVHYKRGSLKKLLKRIIDQIKGYLRN